MNTAKNEYQKRIEEIRQQLQDLQVALSAHETKFQSDDKNWGYVGDLGSVQQSLFQLEAFIIVNK